MTLKKSPKKFQPFHHSDAHKEEIITGYRIPVFLKAVPAQTFSDAKIATLH
jgi:hypothetical protein